MTVYHSNIKLLLMLTLLIHCYIKINCRYCKKKLLKILYLCKLISSMLLSLISNGGTLCTPFSCYFWFCCRTFFNLSILLLNVPLSALPQLCF